MHRGEFRDTIVLPLMAKELPSAATDAISKINNAINLAQREVAKLVPEALYPDVESFYLRQDYDGDNLITGATVTLAATADPYVFVFQQSAAGAVPGHFVPPTTAPIGSQSTASGIYHLEIEDPDGLWHRRQCRNFWRSGANGFYYVAVDRPWWDTHHEPTKATDANMAFRLHQPYFYTRDDVMKVLDTGIWDESRSQMIPLPEGHAAYNEYRDFRGNSNARPNQFFRGPDLQIDAPTEAPTTTMGEEIWDGPDPRGTFTYCYTYCLGFRDYEDVAPGGLLDPLWESGPSPVSAARVSGGSSIVVAMPDIHFMLQFGATSVGASLRSGQAGVYKRLYRARSAVVAGAALNTAVEAASLHQFIANVYGTGTTYTDQGVQPDFFRRRPQSTGYYAWYENPHRDDNYRLDMRVLRRPRLLEHDRDVIRIREEHIGVLAEMTMHYISVMDRDYKAAANHRAMAEGAISEYRASHGSPSEIVIPEAWGGTYTDPTNRRYRVTHMNSV